MNNHGFRQHPDDPRTLLVCDPSLIFDLMARENVTTVILKRGLEKDYTAKFNEKAAWLSQLGTIVGSHNRAYSFSVFLKENEDIAYQIIGKYAERDFLKDFKEAAPEFLWNDINFMSGLAARLNSSRRAQMMVFNERAGIPISSDIDAGTRVWHSHGEEITVHMTMNEAVLELLNKTADEIPSSWKQKQECRFNDNALPTDAKIIKPSAGDIVVFKNVLHRKTTKALELGRFGLGIY